ncbi:hypothetical protein [Streptomyces sp. SID5789]|uniref:hypothetical protein n=1 Tax=Streptomyces sp. SID5789 TaxID=2690310 RepID=UPI001370E58C|nr:hypothetical protein [Streptomyces sp. SID5789]MZE71430.1 hypothetical protein [Streptomyces sp. SID5789]
MRITIEADCRRGLRILEEIPDISLCRIEGYNGIGKSNAIKLLRLCTGDQPFTDDEPSWRTFRSQLVRARIHITGLEGAEDIEWDVEPHRWPESPEPLGDLLGVVRIDGRPARPRDVITLLRVYHILAADTPVSVLADRVFVAHKQVSDWVTVKGDDRQEQIDLLLGDLQRKITDCLPAQLPNELATARAANKLLQERSRQLEATKQRVELIDAAVRVADRLEQVRGRGPEMDAKLQQLQEQINEIDTQRQDLDHQIAGASAQQHKNETAEREFDKAQKHLIRQEKALRQVEIDLQTLAAQAAVSPQQEHVASMRATLGRRLDELSQQLPQVHATPLLTELLKNLTTRLAAAEQRDLGESVLIDATSQTLEWTVSSLKDACLRQIELLSQRTPSEGAEELTREIERVRTRLDALAQATQKITDLELAQRNFQRAEERLRKAASDLPEQAARTLDDLMKARNSLDERGRAVQAEHATLSQTRALLSGGLTEDALTAELLGLCRQADVDVMRVRGRLDDERSELAELTRREAQAAQQAEMAQQAVNERTLNVADTVQFLVTEPNLSWLRRAIPSVQTFSHLDAQAQAEELVKLGDRIENSRNTIRTATSALQGVGAALGELAEHLRRPSRQPVRDSAVNSAARLWLAEEVHRWFESDLVRKALFDGGKDIVLDPKQLMVSWTANGEKRQRPLSAFSSGQQAFAYTQAQVARLDREEVSSANRLIALDEFGAFLDGERMTDLAKYLATRQESAPHDQVLVILPLEVSPGGIPDADAASAHRRQQLRQRGYFAEAFQL